MPAPFPQCTARGCPPGAAQGGGVGAPAAAAACCAWLCVSIASVALAEWPGSGADATRVCASESGATRAIFPRGDEPDGTSAPGEGKSPKGSRTHPWASPSVSEAAPLAGDTAIAKSVSAGFKRFESCPLDTSGTPMAGGRADVPDRSAMQFARSEPTGEGCESCSAPAGPPGGRAGAPSSPAPRDAIALLQSINRSRVIFVISRLTLGMRRHHAIASHHGRRRRELFAGRGSARQLQRAAAARRGEAVAATASAVPRVPRFPVACRALVPSTERTLHLNMTDTAGDMGKPHAPPRCTSATFTCTV